MRIISITPDDWENFREIRLAGIKTDPQAFGGDLSEEIERKAPEWIKRLKSSDRFFFATEDDGRFVAIAGAIKLNDYIWTLVGVYTLPEFRSNGLAKRLVQSVIDESKNRGGSTIQLMVNVDQKDAVNIYEKLGFKILTTIKGEIMADGKAHDEYQMEKNLI